MDESTNNSSGSKVGLVIGIIVILVIAAAGYYFYSTQMNETKPTNQAATRDSDGDDDDDAMAPTTTQASPMVQATEATASSNSGQVSADGTVTFTVDGGNFYFKPNELKVKKDQKVKIVFNNVQGFHDFIIDDLDVKTKQITAGNTAEVEFTPNKKGSFEFYCSVGQHRANGMKGTLVVE